MIDVFGPIKGGISAGDKKVAMRVFMVIFCTFFVPGVSLFFLVKTGFNYNSFPLFFLALIFIAFFVILGVKRLITLNFIDGFFYFLMAAVINFSMSHPIQKEIRLFAAKHYLKNNQELVNKYKNADYLHYLDDEKEREAIYFDNEGELAKNKPSQDWLKRHPSFADCRYWAIPVEKNVYIVNFGC